MKIIYKYQLEPSNQVYQLEPSIQVEIPEGGEVLTFQYQNEIPTIWVLVDTSKPLVKRTFVFQGTGWELPDYDMKYIGTAQQGRFLVWHLFEVIS